MPEFSRELAGQIKNWQSESRLLLELMILKQVSCTGLTLSDKGLKLEISALDTLYNGHFTFLLIKPNYDSLFVSNFLPTARISHFESIFQILTEIQIVFDNYHLSSPKKKIDWKEQTLRWSLNSFLSKFLLAWICSPFPNFDHALVIKLKFEFIWQAAKD